MTMMMARICFYQGPEVEDGIAILKKRGFRVLTLVDSAEPDYVFVEITRGEVTRGDGSPTDRLRAELGDILSAGNVSDVDVGPMPAGHKPFHYDTPPFQ